MRELQHPRVNRKTSLVLEAVSLESTPREDAGPRGQKEELPILALHHTAGPSRGPSISGGPEQNTTGSRPHRKYQSPSNVALNFKLGTAQTITAGTSIAPAEDEIRAVDGAMRPVAHPVAGELRKNRPPVFD